MAGPHFLASLVSGRGDEWSLGVAGRDRPLSAGIECAFDSASRRRGLLGREQFPDDAALIIAPSSGIHTFGMRFPIDVVFAARDGRVLRLKHAMRPNRIAVAFRAFAAIELASGSLARAGITATDRLVITRRDGVPASRG